MLDGLDVYMCVRGVCGGLERLSALCSVPTALCSLHSALCFSVSLLTAHLAGRRKGRVVSSQYFFCMHSWEGQRGRGADDGQRAED
jgi:hypothetical protein